jgi:circadian clock protein KaiC
MTPVMRAVSCRARPLQRSRRNYISRCPMPRTRSAQRNGNSGRARAAALPALDKCQTGIQGFDELTSGGLPRGRPTLLCGGPGCGKTLFSIEFLVRGATQFGEPGVFVSFEETAEDLTKNVASLGFDLDTLVQKKQFAVDYIKVDRSEIEETGEYDLDGLFIRLGYAIDSVGARRIVLDTIESLFAGLSNTAILRAELRRLFSWLKERGVTAIITGERGEGSLTRQGLEEYVSDCVVLLDHRINSGISTRRLRVVKYRGSVHGTNEYPFLIDESGLTVVPITSLGLGHGVTNERVSTGIERLDRMLGGGGYYRGSSILISGTAGSGKSSLAGHFANATCKRGERCLYFAFEESEGQIVRNMRSVGLNLEPHIRAGLLKIHAARPSLQGLEMHLAIMHKTVNDFAPSAVVVDPVSNLVNVGTTQEAHAMLLRLIDFLKMRKTTGVFVSLTSGDQSPETTDVGISSLMDTWLLLRNIEAGGERNRALYVLKSRGMAHSNQVREFVLSDRGVQLIDVYVGPAGVLTGSARLAQEALDAAEEARRRAELQDKEQQFERRSAAIVAQIEALQSELATESLELERARAADASRQQAADVLRDQLGRARDADERPSQATRVRKRNGRSEARS